MIEIERKFLVKGTPELTAGELCIQGYLMLDPARTVRIRLIGSKGFITVKGASKGLSRAEFEYEIPAVDAQEMLDTLCIDSIVEKTRHKVPYGGLMWEIDVFHGKNEGLVMAEVELESENQPVLIPDWVGDEVSDKKQYFNAWLAKYPYSTW